MITYSEAILLLLPHSVHRKLSFHRMTHNNNYTKAYTEVRAFAYSVPVRLSVCRSHAPVYFLSCHISETVQNRNVVIIEG